MYWMLLGLLLPLQSAEEKREPRPLSETVVVTARREEENLADSVALSSVVTREELTSTPALTLDQHLARIPGFGLFRRSSSLTAHPTIQGVSLRGIGPSGAGRSLVLFDGIPLNDPFGGWVYWNRFPLSALEQVEVVRGSGSQLYGSGALAGTIQLIPRRTPPKLEFSLAGGEAEIFDLEALVSGSSGRTRFLAAARAFGTDGVRVIAPELRGAVDRPAGVDFQTFFGRLQRGRFHFGLNYYREERSNGTRLQTNESELVLVEGGLARYDRRLNVYFQSNRLESRFSRILPDRSREFLTAQQDFPSIGLGASAEWDVTTQTTLGADWRFASWDGNRQHVAGLFMQHLVPLTPRLEWLLGVRGDLWQNRATRGSLNPRTGVSYKASARLRLRGSVYRGFRAPTLNELFRPFRVGNVMTEANPDLRQERLWGVEGGAELAPAPGMLLRLNVFRNTLSHPVENETVAVTDTGILRRRANGAPIDATGFEAEGWWERGRWQFRLAYLFTDPQTRNSPLRPPQVARHQGLAGVDFRGPARLRADARWVGRQFEDDRNQLPLGGFVLLDLNLARPLGESFELFLTARNLLDRRYAVGRTPEERLGEPRLVYGGLRWTFANDDSRSLND